MPVSRSSSSYATLISTPLLLPPDKIEEPVLVTDPQWVALAETAATGATVFGILNPASGPGTVTDDTYPEVIDYVVSAGAKVGFGSFFFLFGVPCLSRRPRFRSCLYTSQNSHLRILTSWIFELARVLCPMLGFARYAS